MRYLSVLLSATLVLAAAAPTTAQPVDRDGDGLEDAFETRWGVTDPAAADTDGDGLGDALEDPDGDDLGNHGEQRFGTDPANPDTDGDGTLDGQEDADGDGISDAIEQDQRPAPDTLEPDPRYAWWDRPPNYDDECHADTLEPRLRTCTYGVKDADTTVVLFGDSHALQWQPGLKVAAFQNGWRLENLTKAACPPPQIRSSRKESAAQRSCDAWRSEALEWITSNEPDVVLMTGGGRIYRLEDELGQRIAGDERSVAWNAGLTATLEALPEATAALVLADTPYLQTNPATCLADDPSDLAACSTPRSAAIDPVFDAAEQAAVEAAGGTYVNLSELVCPYSPCPVVFGDILAWRNRDHLTATFVETLAPSLGRAVEQALGEGPGEAEAGSTAPAGAADTTTEAEAADQPFA
ncbi:MAG: SGNH hydrolase domain-containing protein [Candidatus Limnocylindrales bacterium]